MKKFSMCAALVCAGLMSATAQGAYIFHVDIDGSNAGTAVTLNPLFSYGGDTTAYHAASVKSNAVGMNNHNSIYAGNGATQADTYVYSYTPATAGNNWNPAAGTALDSGVHVDDGQVATGAAAGTNGLYNIYATWPQTASVSGGITHYTLTDSLNNVVFDVDIIQNTAQAENLTFGGGGEWVFLATSGLIGTETYTLTQKSSANTFVSMRAAGLLFDQVIPEPTSLALAGLAGLGMLVVRRRS